jgi:light-regulated signal transduction histidine kinase (bacteriophytochrome)
MNAQSNGFQREYISAVDAYLRSGGESALSDAYELGRRALAQGMGVLDMALLHGVALELLVLSAPVADQARLAHAAADIFKELLSLFEMTFRGYREANEKMQRLNDALSRQKEQLEVANQELEAFSYSASHDLRNPLGGIEGLSRLLLERSGSVLDDNGKQCVRMIGKGAQQMRQLIDDLMSLSRVNRTDLHFVDVDLTALAREILARLRASVPERVSRVDIQDGVRANADRNLLAIVLENLFGNAWKFTSRRACTEIAFGCEQLDGQLTYFVRDNGAGFDMARTSNLFAAFQRLHSASEYEGTGIGLNIVQRIVRRHDGRIWAKSNVGGGATFHFTLGGAPAP